MMSRFIFIVLVGAAVSACAGLTLSPTEPPLTRIAFGSCADQKRPQPIWDAVLGYRPQTFLFLGDNVYGDVTSADMAELKTAYEKARAIPAMTALRAQTDILATWDDHDYGANDAGASFPHREHAKNLFLDHWQVPADDERRGRAGIYFARAKGPPGKRVQIVMLDTRSFRSDPVLTGNAARNTVPTRILPRRSLAPNSGHGCGRNFGNLPICGCWFPLSRWSPTAMAGNAGATFPPSGKNCLRQYAVQALTASSCCRVTGISAHFTLVKRAFPIRFTK